MAAALKMASVSWKWPSEMNEWLNEEAKRAGVTKSREILGRLQQSRNFDASFGGPRERALFQGVAQMALAKFGAGWMDEPFSFLGCEDLIREMMLAVRPAASNSEWLLAAARRALDSFKAHPEPDRIKIARDLFDQSQACIPEPDPAAASRVETGRVIAIAEATISTAEIDVDLEAGRITQAEAGAALKGVRAKIAAAVRPDAVPAPASGSESSNVSRPVFATSLLPPSPQTFWPCWLLAQAATLDRLGRPPSDDEIAQAFADDPVLLVIANLHQHPDITGPTILAFHNALLARDRADDGAAPAETA
jgi:hypothetical protein